MTAVQDYDVTYKQRRRRPVKRRQDTKRVCVEAIAYHRELNACSYK